MKKILFALLPLLAFASCKQNSSKTFHIEGRLKGMPPLEVVISEVGFQNSVIVDSARSANDGSFKLSGHYKEPGLYTIRLGINSLTVVVEQNNMSIAGDWKDLNHLKITGSPATASLMRFNNNFHQYSRKLIGLRMVHDSLMKSNVPDSVLKTVDLQTNQESKALIQFVKDYADSAKSPIVAIYAASNLLTADQPDYLKQFASNLNARFPEDNTTFVKDFKVAVKAKLASIKANQYGLAIGSMAPDFKMQTLDGKEISLHDFKGKYVLLDFWASWCPPCRAENPNVVNAYATFKNRDFAIVSFSLDNNHKKWAEAVKNDHLRWTQTSDLKGWQSPVASAYGVEAIPMNFLIDPTGKIIARNLRGQSLKSTLAHTLPKK